MASKNATNTKTGNKNKGSTPVPTTSAALGGGYEVVPMNPSTTRMVPAASTSIAKDEPYIPARIVPIQMYSAISSSNIRNVSVPTTTTAVQRQPASFATVQDILDHFLPSRVCIPHWKPTWLRNTVRRTRPDTSVDPATNRQLSISFFYPALKLGVCSASGSGRWHRSDPATDEYYSDVDEFKVAECKKHGITILMLPMWVDMKDAENKINTFLHNTLEQFIPLDTSYKPKDDTENSESDEDDEGDNAQDDGYGSD